MFAALLNHICVIWQDVVLDLINQTRVLRIELSQKDETISHLSGDIKDITVLYTHSLPFALFPIVCFK